MDEITRKENIIKAIVAFAQSVDVSLIVVSRDNSFIQIANTFDQSNDDVLENLFYAMKSKAIDCEDEKENKTKQ